MSNFSRSLGLVLDVCDLDEATRFWEVALGAKVVGRALEGTVLEQRTLACEHGPGLVIELHNCWPRSPSGTTPGGIRELAVYVDDPSALLGRVEGLSGVGVIEDGLADRGEVFLVTPGGYRVRFRRSA